MVNRSPVSLLGSILHGHRVASAVALLVGLVVAGGCANMTGDKLDPETQAKCDSLKEQIRGIERSSMSEFRKRNLISVYQNQMVEMCGTQ